MLNYLIVDKIINDALKEDIPYGDITASAIVTNGSKAKASLIAKEDGIICGLPVFERVFTILGDVTFKSFINEGSSVTKGDIIGELYGDALNILMGERVALNLLQKMSGIATLTNKYVKKLEGLNTKLLDTRKTTANLRILEKYAVKIGGGHNHRFSLSDGILIKDNHIGYAGSIKNAIKLAKENSININIYSGQEVYYSRNILEYYNQGMIGTINNTRYMLIEFPMLEFNIEEAINTLYELQIRGIVPIIAHPERYKQFIKNPSQINLLIKEGMLFQVNAGSINGDFGRDVKKTAIKYLNNNIYSFIGSDAHRDKGRNTDIKNVIEILEYNQRKSFINNGKAMLKNEEIEFRGIPIKEKKFLGIF